MIRAVASLASIVVLGMTVSAQAGKYTCNFSVNGKAPAQASAPCKIDTADSNSQTCQYKFAKMVATCGAAQIDPNLDGLLCAFTSNAPSTADFLKDTVEPSIANIVGSLHKKAGFTAGAVNVAAPTSANVSVGYATRRGAPQLAAICSPTAAP